MRITNLVLWGAALWPFSGAVLAGATAGCSSHQTQTVPAQPTGAIGGAVSEVPRDKALELIESARREIGDLQDIRSDTKDKAWCAAIDDQIESISHYRAALVADLAVPGTNAKRLDIDASNLRRVMLPGAATEMQASAPLAVEPRGPISGGDVSVPPPR
jgi:hypothetical protein